MQIAGYKHQASKHSETGHLRNILAHHGVVAPHTGEPFTEAMLLGLGGGLDGAYFLCGGCGDGKFLVLGGRRVGVSTRAEFLETVARRLGATARVQETGGARAAVGNLTAALAAGQPTVVWVALGLVPYHLVAEGTGKGLMYTLLVHGLDEDADVAHV